MAKKKKKNKRLPKKENMEVRPFLWGLTSLSKILPDNIKKWILGIIIFVFSIIIILSFFNLAGVAGKKIMEVFNFLIGQALYLIPLILLLGGISFFRAKYQNFLALLTLAALILIIGTAGFLESLIKQGGYLGYLISFPFLRFFGPMVTQIIFLGIILIAILIFYYLLNFKIILFQKRIEKVDETAVSSSRSVFQALKNIKKSNEIKSISKEALTLKKSEVKNNLIILSSKIKPLLTGKEYTAPLLDLLTAEKGKPSAGDTAINSAIIKETLKNFGLEVEMSEINIGPTVTQYTLKPAEGIKLSKITALSNNLSLALASPSIRIEAPIPGKSLVGVEIPNKERCLVRLKELISNAYFQEADSNLVFVLGRDVSGSPCYADLAKMPHLLVAGSTGTGKTIFLNNFILSLLYRNSPETLRMILIDPKRVEFSSYHGLPHLLTPVIFDAQKTINALKWLVKEMERRFDVLSENGSRNILSYNEKVLKNKEKRELLPYIVLIIDELADLMAARGREMEAGIVRLAQMSRAVGIHLVLATQRPSVEVITGLIKANITSRVAFQVASQVDSRTILDMSGAEKLLGSGDLLFTSAQIVKPKRIQGAYITEKEVKKVVDYIKTENQKIESQNMLEEDESSSRPFTVAGVEKEIVENHLADDLTKFLNGQIEGFNNEEDPLYEEAKKIVIAAKKASASLLQRRLSIGYARAARLLDVLEEKGVVGPGEGAKPREVYFSEPSTNTYDIQTNEQDEDNWKKI